jgi:uncharacterized protein (UPF0332 family)
LNEIEPLLEKARRSFDVAEATLEQGHADFAISRAYYGCFYIAQAMLLSEGLEYASHGQVVAQFGLHFAKTKRLDPMFHRLLSRAFQLRQGADYATSVVIEAEWVREILEGGRRFLAAAASYLTPPDRE